MTCQRTRYRNKNVLITGGLGFIGSNLARKLVDCGARVTVVDSLAPQCGGNRFNISGIRNKVHVKIADIQEKNCMEKLVRGKDILFNLAGQISHIDSMSDPFTDVEINVKNQLFILEACRKNNPDIKIIYASTRQIYGKPRVLPVKETHPLHPLDINGIDKMTGEWYHRLYHNVYGLQTTSLRLTNTYGPRQLMKHNRQGFIGWFIRSVIENRGIKLYGTGKQIRDLNYVDDVTDAFLLAGLNDRIGGKIYNLGGIEPTSLLDLAKLLIEINGGGRYTVVPFPGNMKRIDIGDYYGHYGKIQNELGWKPKVRLREGLEKTIAYYRKYRKHYWETS